MNNASTCYFRRASTLAVLLLASVICQLQVQANPTGGTVAQGTATFNTSGSQLTINQTSGTAFINWQSFNIGVGETVTFNQPSSSSVAWNYINDPNASSLNGTLNANGYVVLQNPNGFSIGGTASITAHGLVMTTASTPNLDLSSGGPWSFNTPPPTAKIINYGQINITGGGSAFLIASDIENNGAISAPAGNIGLYAGQTVLVSTSPDGRGLSAKVTLPTGSVDNEGNLIADAGSIAAQAQYVNQNGLIQANSVQNYNGVIELVASDNVNLGPSSVISAQGASTGTSSGGSVTLQAGNTFSDQAGSVINVAGGAQGGNGGHVEISAPQMSALQSSINGQAADGFIGGTLTIDPLNLWLASAATDPNAPANYSVVNVNDFTGLSQINLQADNNIEVSTLWNLAALAAPGTLSLTAGNNITLDDGAGIAAGNNWNVNFTAGTALALGSLPASGNSGIYLNGSAYLQTQNGDINLWAANEVIVSSGAIRTVNGGSIGVTAEYGDVNTGTDVNGYLFGQGYNRFGRKTGPYYTVSANLGGISTAAGGNVTINAGGNVISYLPVQNDWTDAQYDGGTGAFGPEPGNVTITAGDNVCGHYVVANGVGTITAGGNVGAPLTDSDPTKDDFALSLIKGSWSVYAPNGSIYVQDINNPNGIFGEGPNQSASNYGGYHVFDYDPDASVLLDAGDSVEITGQNAPQSAPSVLAAGNPIPLILPPSFAVITGSGDFILDASVILFPSPDQNLNLSIGGNFIGIPNGNPINLEMSDSAATRWINLDSFGTSDHGATPLEVNNHNPVVISVAGNMENVNLYTTKETQISVGGNIQNCGFVGENLHASDVTSINVGGSIENSPLYSFESLLTAIISANSLQPGAWDSVFDLAVNPSMVSAITSFDANDVGANGLAYYLKTQNYLLFPSGTGSSATYGQNPGFVYDSNTKQLGFKGSLSSILTPGQISALESGSITVLVTDSAGNPIIDANGHLEVKTYTFDWGTAVAKLDADSQGNTTTAGLGFQIGGPGQFNISAGYINLGDSAGIVSYGFGQGYGANFASLESLCGTLDSGGAAVNVNVAGNLDMVTSRICSIDGGDVTVNAGGEINLSQGTFVFPVTDCYGIWTSGHSDVSVTANGTINVGSSRIATFNGGSVFVESYDGDVNCGTGANIALAVCGIYLDPNTGLPVSGFLGNLVYGSVQTDPPPYGSGILAEYPTASYQTPGSGGQPGNITVETPNGNIVSGQGGIMQIALGGSIGGGPTVTLIAGTDGVAATPEQGNILLGGMVVGGTVNAITLGNGTITGFYVAQNDLNITGLSFTGVGSAGGMANLNTSQAAGVVVGIEGINATGSGPVSLLSQNVNNGSGAQSTLGTSVSASTASQSAAQQANSQEQQQVASTDTGDDDQKKKKKKEPLIQRAGRVTVILSTAVPAQ